MQPTELDDQRGGRGFVLVDGHVHLRSCFGLYAFLESACASFGGASEELQLPGLAGRCLILVGSSGSRTLSSLRGYSAVAENIGPWRFVPTDEDDSLAVTAEGRQGLFLVAGQQVATREGVEVLALACDREIPDGMALRDTIEKIQALEAIPVLPWGFGKWWFHRYTIVRDLLLASDPKRVFIGDSAGRSGWAPRSRVFALARSRGILNLPGSDPLPFLSQIEKVGRFGFVLEGRFDRRRPAASIRELLNNLVRQPSTYGRSDSLATIFRCQIAMHLGGCPSIESSR